MEKTMQHVIGIILITLFIIFLIIMHAMKKRVLKEEYSYFAEKENSYTLVVRGYDWGPAVPKIIVNIGEHEKKMTSDDIVPENFCIKVTTSALGTRIRPITKVYPCDIDGNEIEDVSQATHLAFEFSVHPDDHFFSPIYYNEKKMLNVWKKEYSYSIESKFLDGNITTPNENYYPDSTQCTVMKEIKNNRLHALYFTPNKSSDKKKRPLIIWLHGAGEGGTDPTIVLYGNKVTALTSSKIQSYFDGAYVLCPQTPTVWMNAGSGPYDIVNSSVTNKSSQYTKECKEVIDTFIKAHKDIDTNRIYICGCSNGGYMTLNMLLTYPHFFAAAAPVCEAYSDSWLTQNHIDALAKEHLWFIAAKTDTTVPPQSNAEATVARLNAAGATDVHFSYFDDVHDTSSTYFTKDGKPYEYLGHWSWIYLFNDECSDEEEPSVWKWMAEKSLAQ